MPAWTFFLAAAVSVGLVSLSHGFGMRLVGRSFVAIAFAVAIACFALCLCVLALARDALVLGMSIGAPIAGAAALALGFVASRRLEARGRVIAASIALGSCFALMGGLLLYAQWIDGRCRALEHDAGCAALHACRGEYACAAKGQDRCDPRCGQNRRPSDARGDCAGAPSCYVDATDSEDHRCWIEGKVDDGRRCRFERSEKKTSYGTVRRAVCIDLDPPCAGCQVINTRCEASQPWSAMLDSGRR